MNHQSWLYPYNEAWKAAVGWLMRAFPAFDRFCRCVLDRLARIIRGSR